MSVQYNVDVMKTNNPTLNPSDIVYDITYSIDKMGIVHTNFRTLEKYYDVANGGTLYDYGEFSLLIEISPHLLDEEGRDLASYNDSAYRSHPDWFFMILEIKCSNFNDQSFIPVITPMKHEYHVAHIPIDYAIGYDLEYSSAELQIDDDSVEVY